MKESPHKLVEALYPEAKVVADHFHVIVDANRSRKTTNGFTKGCHTKIKMRKRVSYGLRNIDVY